MSAARRQLMWLWAAVWLRWRLTRVKARRLFGGPAVAVGGLDYHLAPAETPVEGVDYNAEELPAQLTAKLEAARVELLERARDRAAPARPRRARRSRIAVLATAGILGLGAVGAGAAALVTGSTGVPAVDRLLGIYEAELDGPTSSGDPRDTAQDLRPGSVGRSTSVEVRLASRRLVSTSYVSRGGEICSALAESEEDSPGHLSCPDQSLLTTGLARDDGVVLGVLVAYDRVLVRGFVVDRVTRLEGRGPNGPLDVHLGEKWTPGLPGVGSLKPFAAVGGSETPGDASGLKGSDPLRLANPGGYTLNGVTEAGEKIRLAP